MSTFLRRRLGGKGLDVVRLLGLVDALVRVRLDDLLDVESNDVLSCGVRFCSVHGHASTTQPQRGLDYVLGHQSTHTHIGDLVFPVGG